MTATCSATRFDSHAEQTGVPSLLREARRDLGIGFKDLSTHQSSLEDIFVEPGSRGIAA